MNAGARQRALPSGVVTFLFTDIEGSTRRWETDPDVMRAALADHDEVVRAAIEAHQGRVFKHTGDGVCAVFTSPKSAVDAAVAAQQALELPVRVGISTGEAELRGSDYFGAVLNRAARIMAAGHGGQILLDGQTAGLLHGVNLVDLGSRRLRDITDPVPIFQVRAPGLRTEFPPLSTQDPASGNLRVPSTSLIGRESEVAGVAAVLKAHRVVTLTGPGGVGKTRLAVEVAGRVADSFPDGVWVIELAPVAAPVAVPEAFAAVLGIIQQPGLTLADSVAAALEGRSRLLVVDNCEHVLDAAGDLIELILSRSSTVSILATSRQGLQLADERLWPLPALDTTTGVESAAVALFLERGEAVAPGISLAGDAGAVVEICRRLDGIPLAIELAASRMQSMTATEVRDRLNDRFRLLVGSRRGPQHHHTLRHAVAWSYDLLDDAEKTLLERCSVFAGGFDLAAACAVSDSDDELTTLDLLDALVRKSLLVADRSAGRTRFSMLETIRQFAEEQLVASGEATEARIAHARYFAGREADILALWDSPRQREAYDWFTIELPNLRAGFRCSADHGDLDVAATIATYAGFLGMLIESFESIAWAEELLGPARAVDHPRLAALYVIAAQCYMAGRIDEAIRYSDAAQRAICDERDEVPYDIHDWLAGAYPPGAYVYIGRPHRAIEWCRTQLARGRDTHTVTRATLASMLAIAGCADEAKSAATGLIEAAEATRNPFAISYAILVHGFTCRDTYPSRALQDTRRGLMTAQDSGNRTNATHLASLLARLEAEHGDPLAALDHFTVAIRNYQDSGDTTTIRVPLAALAAFLDRLGRHEPAATIAGFAVSPLATQAVPELGTAIAHLRDVLGEATYESLARQGEKVTTAAMATYAYDQIDQARTRLKAVLE